jgi:hypothetical protein
MEEEEEEEEEETSGCLLAYLGALFQSGRA